MTEETAEIGIIGGTGVYGVQGMINIREIDVDTPFGKPSSKIMIGTVADVAIAFIARHNIGHLIPPNEINYQANIYAMKTFGVKYLISITAVGSLREDYKPADIVLVDQYIDRTFSRKQTFFGDGIVAHIPFGEPVCMKLKDLVKEALVPLNVNVHETGTLVCIEGPAFSTKAESNMFRQWGASVVGMTAIPEAKLAREAEIAYVSIAMVTDYDCWHPDHDQVTVDLVMENLKKNGFNAQRAVVEIAKLIKDNRFVSKAHNTLQDSIMTPVDRVPPETLTKLKPILANYLSNLKAAKH
jgi:5'-methylthioadenosine phosphorylase